MPHEYPITQDFHIKWHGSIVLLRDKKTKKEKIAQLRDLTSSELYYSVIVGGKAWLHEISLLSQVEVIEIHKRKGILSSGFFNIEDHCFYKARLSAKQYRKGIANGNCEIYYPDGLLLYNNIKMRGLGDVNIVNTIANPPVYPSLEEIKNEFKFSNVKARALNENIAIVRAGPEYIMYLNNAAVGILDKDFNIIEKDPIVELLGNEVFSCLK